VRERPPDPGPVAGIANPNVAICGLRYLGKNKIHDLCGLYSFRVPKGSPMFSIKTRLVKMTIEIVPVASLLLHEAIIPRAVDSLVLAFKNLACLQNPIIVDDNNVVLDGNHRTYAFRKLKFNYMPVCRIDYFNENAKLKNWFRLFGNIRRLGRIKRVIEMLGGSFRPVMDKKILEEIMEQNNLTCGIQKENYYAYAEFPSTLADDAVSVYRIIQQIQDELVARGITLSYIPCKKVHDDQFCTELKADEVVLWTPRLTKKMVVESAKMEKVFAPKTTRHLIPARPLNVNVPGYWLRENVSLEKINERLVGFLEKKRVKRFGPGQVIDGRYYEEELFVFY